MKIYIFTSETLKSVYKTGFTVNNNLLNLCLQVKNYKGYHEVEKQFLIVSIKDF